MVTTNPPISKQRRQQRMWNPTFIPPPLGYNDKYLMMSFVTDIQQQETNWIAKINKRTLQPMIMSQLGSAKTSVKTVSVTNCEMAYSAALRRYFYLTCMHDWNPQQGQGAGVGFITKSGTKTPLDTLAPTPSVMAGTQQQGESILPLNCVALKNGTGVMADSKLYQDPLGMPQQWQGYALFGVDLRKDLSQKSAYNPLWYRDASQQDGEVRKLIRSSTDRLGNGWIIDSPTQQQQTLVRVRSGGVIGKLAKTELIPYPDNPPAFNEQIVYVSDVQTDRNGDVICLFDTGQQESVYLIKYLAALQQWLGDQATNGQWCDTQIEGEEQQGQYHKISGAIDAYNNIWAGDPEAEIVSEPILYAIRNDNFGLSQSQTIAPTVQKVDFLPSDLFPSPYQGVLDDTFRISGVRGDQLGNVFAVGRFYSLAQVGGTNLQQRLFLLKIVPPGAMPDGQQAQAAWKAACSISFVDLTDALSATSQADVEGLDVSCEDELGRKDY